MTALPLQAEESYTFGPFELLPGRQLLMKDGVPIPIGSRPFDVLSALVRQGGTIVGKRQLMAQVWPGLVVDDANLKVNIAALRRTLGDDPDQPVFIATIIGRGYRFIAPIGRPGAGYAPSPFAVETGAAGNLPSRMQPIFGRSAVIARIAEELETVRLVSLVGPGGIGKTTVALAIARQLAPALADGAWLVDLTELQPGEAVERAIADVLALAETDDVFDALSDRNLLLVLDNCEHVIEEAANFADVLLSRTRKVKLLTTSREPLSIRAERVRRLSGLAVPPARSRATEALEYAAVQLFVDRASEGSFRLDDVNAPLVSELCRRVEGLALGIERMAMRADTIEIEWLLDHLEAGRHMLDDHQLGPERHRTLTAVVDWSYRLLGADEQRVLRLLSAFARAFTLDAACVVATSDDLTQGDIVDIVAGLAAKSLLGVATLDGEAEYRLSHIVRAYGLGQLATHGETAQAQRRRAEVVLAALEGVAANTAALSATWFADVREAVTWALVDAAGADLAVRLIIAGAPLFQREGLEEDCRTAVIAVLDPCFRTHLRAEDETALRAILSAPLPKNRIDNPLKGYLHE